MDVKSEFKQAGLYVVNYDENLWYALDEERRAFCTQTWLQKASMLECTALVLRLHPDDFFPMHGHDKPYIASNTPLEGSKPALFRVETVAFVELTDAWHKLPEVEQMAVRAEAREAAKRAGADRWEIRFGSNRFESGRK